MATRGSANNSPLPPSSPSPAPKSLEAPAAYLRRHHIHVVVDRLARDILREQPEEPTLWMQRWLLEEHRKQCAAKHQQQQAAIFEQQQAAMVGGAADTGARPASALGSPSDAAADSALPPAAGGVGPYGDSTELPR